jgi:hypothetical protein
MGDCRHTTRSEQPWRILLAVLCVLLVVVTGIAQVAHTHSDGGATHADCALCAAAHVSVQIAYAPAAAPPIAVATPVETAPAVLLLPTLSAFALFTRPPPASSSAA